MTKIEYLLTLLNEECLEVGQAVCKTLRFGLDDAHPKHNNKLNKDRIEEELNHVLAVIDLLAEEGITFDSIYGEDMVKEKKEKVKKYMEYSKERGHLI